MASAIFAQGRGHCQKRLAQHQYAPMHLAGMGAELTRACLVKLLKEKDLPVAADAEAMTERARTVMDAAAASIV